MNAFLLASTPAFVNRPDTSGSSRPRATGLNIRLKRLIPAMLAMGVGFDPEMAGAATPTLDQLNQKIVALETKVNTLQSALTAVQSNSVLALADKLHYDISANAAVFTGVDVQIVNGANETNIPNGTGNLILGYNEFSNNAQQVCIDGRYSTPVDCIEKTGMGGHWGPNLRTGSHNLVIGRYHSYTRWAGIVAGEDNAINGPTATVLGGRMNRAGVEYGVVSGGSSNVVSGGYGVIGGGLSNAVFESYGTIGGGENNLVGGLGASISGGSNNQAIGVHSSVSGGNRNVASGEDSSVSGGQVNKATGSDSSVSGGVKNIASGIQASVSGGYKNTASAYYSSVTGGDTNSANADASTIGGGTQRQVWDKYDWRAGTLFADW